MSLRSTALPRATRGPPVLDGHLARLPGHPRRSRPRRVVHCRSRTEPKTRQPRRASPHRSGRGQVDRTPRLRSLLVDSHRQRHGDNDPRRRLCTAHRSWLAQPRPGSAPHDTALLQPERTGRTSSPRRPHPRRAPGSAPLAPPRRRRARIEWLPSWIENMDQLANPVGPATNLLGTYQLDLLPSEYVQRQVHIAASPTASRPSPRRSPRAHQECFPSPPTTPTPRAKAPPQCRCTSARLNQFPPSDVATFYTSGTLAAFLSATA